MFPKHFDKQTERLAWDTSLQLNTCICRFVSHALKPIKGEEMETRFRTRLKYTLIGGAIITVVVLLVWWWLEWYLTSSIVARSDNTDTAVWYEGWLNGILAVPSFIASLFSDEYGIYRANNTGVWYNFWYLVGAGTLFGSRSHARHRD